jgi:N-methylhydantoinase A
MAHPSDLPHTLVGVDTGGTFTDFVFMDESGTAVVDKRPSNPRDPAKPVLEGLAHLESETFYRVVHGTTVATNALLEHKIGRTALITTAGFEDVLEIARQNRPGLYDIHPVKTPPLIPREYRFGVHERVLYDGTVHTPLEKEELEPLLGQIRSLGIEAIAVCLLHSYANPAHEEFIGEAAEALGFTVSLSSRVLPEFREYERASTVVVNAALRPVMQGYLERLERGVERARLNVMQSAGGVIPAPIAAVLPVHTVLSGPAGGVIAAGHVGSLLGLDRLITFDMGGTSTDVSLYEGRPTLSNVKTVAGHPIRVPVIDIHTVGAGGGSIAYRDLGGGLKVGPVSAGADPGPICYGRGDQVTVTDANLLLGRIEPSSFLGGRMELHPELVRAPMERLGRTLGLDPTATAEGIVTVVNAAMERAIRVISIQQGHDPREFTLVSFGGAGGLHAVDLARSLNIPRVLAPKNAGVFSAYGMVLAPVVRDLSRTVLRAADRFGGGELDALFSALVEGGLGELESEGLLRERVRVERSLDMRYRGQSHEIGVPLAGRPAASFEAAHERLYGYRLAGTRVEVVTLRARLIVEARSGRSETPAKSKKNHFAAPVGKGKLIYGGESLKAAIYKREELAPGAEIEGPGLVVESSSTILIPPGSAGVVDEFGNIMVWVDGFFLDRKSG